MVAPEGAVYCTLLLSDNYLPGAVVLAHSLRDNGSEAKLVALYTPDTLQATTINELQTVYDVLIPVYRMTNHTPANLWLMDRPDLIATFTKIELWRQTQFKRIVYIDSDVVSIRAPDELLNLDVDFAAAPDVGWPDCFNSGVMVLTPNMQDYFALKALAESGTSFDGADQGLLNMHFRDWHRLSFAYNCTPSANYQYIPAYNHFQSTISLIHFIGSQKPWNMSRQVAPYYSPYNQLLGRWWTIYDRHYRAVEAEQIQITPQIYHTEPAFSERAEHTPENVQQQHFENTSFAPSIESSSHQHFPQPKPSHHQKLEHHAPEHHEIFQPPYHAESTSAPYYAEQAPHSHGHDSGQSFGAVMSAVPQYVRGEEHVRTYIQHQPHQPHREHIYHVHHPVQESSAPPEHFHTSDHGHSEPQIQSQEVFETRRTPSPHPPSPEEPTFEAPKAEWDASREPPPVNSKPEGIALESKTYTMSDDHQLFQPPASYPEAPKNMYYQVPETKPEPQKLAQIFPWETNAPKPTRVFPNEQPQPQPAPSPTFTREDSQSSQPTSWTSEVSSVPSESWDTYSRSNAWDEVPEIQKYIQSIQQARKARVQVLSGGSSKIATTPPTPTQQTQNTTSFSESRSGPNLTINTVSRITDFPSELERPSLPVTPAPIHRAPPPDFNDGDGEGEDKGKGTEYTSTNLPAAAGVPNQEDWNPSAGLDELLRRRDSVLEDPTDLDERLGRVVEAEADADTEAGKENEKEKQGS